MKLRNWNDQKLIAYPETQFGTYRFYKRNVYAPIYYALYTLYLGFTSFYLPPTIS